MTIAGAVDVDDALTPDQVEMMLDTLALVVRPPFDRPLVFGDPEQLAAMRVINGRDAYCSHCYHAHGSSVGVEAVGLRCPRCGEGYLLPGAAIEVAWRRYAFLD